MNPRPKSFVVRLDTGRIGRGSSVPDVHPSVVSGGLHGLSVQGVGEAQSDPGGGFLHRDVIHFGRPGPDERSGHGEVGRGSKRLERGVHRFAQVH